MSTYTRVKTFVANETLTASDLNNEFNNIITNTNSANLNSDNVSTSAAWTWTGVHTMSTSSSLNFNDDIYVKFGTAPDYLLRYNNSNTALELTTSNSDGSGTDATVIDIQDGTDDVRIRGGLATDNNTAPTTGLKVGGVIVSDTDSTDDLGTTSVRWANVYTDAIGDTGQALTVKSSDVTVYHDANNADVAVSMGTSATEALFIEALNGSSNKTLEELRFTTKTASGTGNHGKVSFYIDEAAVATIDDTGINIESGMTYRINGTSIDAGDVQGPGSSTDNATMRFDGTGGKTAQNSGVIIDDSNNVSGIGTLGVGGVTTVGGNIVSDTDSTDDLGTSSVRWANVYTDKIGDSGQTLSVGAGTLSFDAAATIDSSGNNAITIDSGSATLSLDAGTIESDATTLSFDGATSIDTSGNNNLTLSAGTATLIVTAGDVTIYDDNNNADTSLAIGTSATEALFVEALNGGSNKTLEELRFTTKTASGTGDHGKMSFYVDEVEIATIDDGGIDLASGLSFTVAGSAIGGASLSGSTDNTLVTVTGSNALTSEADVTYDASTEIFQITSDSASLPVFTLKNTNNGATSALIKFINDKGAAGADNDVCGTIEFYGDDDNQDNIRFAKIEGVVADASNGDECGALKFYVAENDGNNTVGLQLTGSTTDGEVDVTIGAGAASTVSIPGDIALTGGIDLGSDATGDMYYRDGSGHLARIAVGSDNHVLTLDGTTPGWEAASSGGISWSGSTSNGIGYYKDSDEIYSSSVFTHDGTDVVLTSSTSAKPVFTIQNTNADANPCELKFDKDSASSASGDVIGKITFWGSDDAENAQELFAQIEGYQSQATATDENGGLKLGVASCDGTLVNALQIRGSHHSGSDAVLRITQENNDGANWILGGFQSGTEIDSDWGDSITSDWQCIAMRGAVLTGRGTNEGMYLSCNIQSGNKYLGDGEGLLIKNVNGGIYWQTFANNSSGEGATGSATNFMTLNTSGDLHITGSYTSSDERMKSEIETISGVKAFETVKALEGKTFKKLGNPEFGFVAQDLQKVDIAERSVERRNTGGDYLDVNYGMFAGLHNEAIKELIKQVETLQDEVNALKAG